MSRGFTLIELLVALTLLALLFAVLFGGLRLGGTAAARVEARAENLEDLRLVQTFLRRQLTTARPVIWIVNREPVVAFEGRPDGLDFVGELPAHLAGGGRQAIRLQAEADGGLTLTWRPLAADDRAFAFAGGRRHRLSDRFGALRFAYYGPRPANGPPQWHDVWRGVDGLPALIRLQAIGEEPPWPGLIVAPRLDPGLR